MRVLSRALARWDLLRVAAAGIALAWVALLAAFAIAAASVLPDLTNVIAALAVLAIAAAGFLYAWREPGV